MFFGQAGVIAYFVLRQAVRCAEAIQVVGAGLTISLSVILGLPAVLFAAWGSPLALAHAVYRLSGAALDLVAEFPRRRRRAGHPGRRLGPAVARARARGDTGIHGRGAEIRAGRRRVVVVGDRVLRRRADVGRDSRARLSLSRLVGIKSSGWPAPSSCPRWRGPRCTCSTTGSSSARCSPSACCWDISVTAATRPG